MRHALGLHGSTTSRSTAEYPTTSTGVSQPPKRRFVRTARCLSLSIAVIINRVPRPAASNWTEPDRPIRSEAMAGERAERSLEEAQVTIHDLQTKLAHERLARIEALEAALQAATAEQAVQQTLQSVQGELVARGWHSGTPRTPLQKPWRVSLRPRAGTLSPPTGWEAVVAWHSIADQQVYARSVNDDCRRRGCLTVG
jgi:hypothetical protein